MRPLVALSAFLDVSSLNLAVPQGAAIFLSGASPVAMLRQKRPPIRATIGRGYSPRPRLPAAVCLPMLLGCLWSARQRLQRSAPSSNGKASCRPPSSCAGCSPASPIPRRRARAPGPLPAGSRYPRRRAAGGRSPAGTGRLDPGSAVSVRAGLQGQASAVTLRAAGSKSPPPPWPATAPRGGSVSRVPSPSPIQCRGGEHPSAAPPAQMDGGRSLPSQRQRGPRDRRQALR
jgi:hypothetical protein